MAFYIVIYCVHQLNMSRSSRRLQILSFRKNFFPYHTSVFFNIVGDRTERRAITKFRVQTRMRKHQLAIIRTRKPISEGSRANIFLRPRSLSQSFQELLFSNIHETYTSILREVALGAVLLGIRIVHYVNGAESFFRS
jgi:hypothetical protein